MIALLCGLVLGVSGLGEAERQTSANHTSDNTGHAFAAYRAGRYAEASKLFRAALSGPGVPQGPVLYNLGNCAYRLGRHAEAVLFFRRAQLRLPGDRAVEFNRRLAERQLGIYAAPSESGAGAALAWVDSLTPGALLALVAALQCIGLAGLVFVRRRRAVRGALALIVLLGLLGAVRLVQWQWFAGPPTGVVLPSQIALRPEPHRSQPITLELRAGAIVRVEEASDRWARVVHARGAGWTERAGVGLVD